MKRWHESRRIILQTFLLAACCLAAVFIRSIVASDASSDLATVGLEFGGLTLFIVTAAIAVAAAYRACGRIERVALRIIPVAVLVAGIAFVEASYADVSIALHALASQDQDEPTRIELGPTGRDVRLTGTLSEGAGARLAAILDKHPQVTRIHLTSDGGLVDEGDALQRVIATHRLETFVPDYCVSACTLAFLGGRQRFMMTDARIGFHAPFEEGLFGQIFEGDKRAERASYVATGIAVDFVDKALAVPSADIWTPDADLLKKARVVTEVVDRYRFPDSNLDGAPTLAGARAAVLRNFPLAKALDRWRPGDVDAIAATYLDAYREGMSEGDVTDGLKAVIGGAAELAIVNGDDETIVSYGRLLNDAAHAATSDEDCANIGSEIGLAEAEEVLDRGDGQTERLEISLLTRALQSQRKLASATTPVDGIDARQISIGGTCSAVRGFYKRALSLPRHEAAILIRSRTQRQMDAGPDPVVHED